VDLVLAYRPNGCIVGCKTAYDYNTSVNGDYRQSELAYMRSTQCFGHLAAPPVGQTNVRPVIVACAGAVPDDIANDVVELVNEIGGSDSGFEAATLLTEFSDFDNRRSPLEFRVERQRAIVDVPYTDQDGSQRCPVCDEINCGWLAHDLKRDR